MIFLRGKEKILDAFEPADGHWNQGQLETGGVV